MAPLFEQTLIIGHIEYELAKAAKFRSDSLRYDLFELMTRLSSLLFTERICCDLVKSVA